MSIQPGWLHRLKRPDGNQDRPPVSPNRPLKDGVTVPLPASRSAAAGKLPGPIRGLLLDMCGVLYDNTIWRRWVLQLLGRMGLHTNYCCFFRVWERDYLADVHCGRRKFWEAFRCFLKAAGLRSGQIDEVEAAGQARRRTMLASTRPLPGVVHTLDRLHRSGFVLGVIGDSECPADVLQERLDALGLGATFATVVSSYDLKQTMPDPVCYRTALDCMGLLAEEVAFVGHDTAQLAGAAALGMPTIAFNFDRDARADVQLGRFEELFDVVTASGPLAATG